MDELDRCDGCSAAAYVRFRKGTRGKKILDFCGHHSNKHSAKLLGLNWKKIQDNREEQVKSTAGVS